ncbi:MAG: hypothetical protein QM764_01210 [Chitinophagaceae bacterium]
MPVNPKYLADFYENGIFHVYNRTNNNEHLFKSEENYIFFLKQYSYYLSPFIETFCWCLLPNHFHLLIRVKETKDIQSHFSKLEKEKLTLTEKNFIEGKKDLSELIEVIFKNFFQSYSQSFNKAYNRKGNLFYRPFKRVEINSDSHFTQSIIYIHANALKHNLIEDFKNYKWSSWKSLLSNSPTGLLRNEVLEWFGGKDLFIKTHEELSKFYYDCETAIEN